MKREEKSKDCSGVALPESLFGSHSVFAPSRRTSFKKSFEGLDVDRDVGQFVSKYQIENPVESIMNKNASSFWELNEKDLLRRLVIAIYSEPSTVACELIKNRNSIDFKENYLTNDQPQDFCCTEKDKIRVKKYVEKNIDYICLALITVLSEFEQSPIELAQKLLFMISNNSELCNNKVSSLQTALLLEAFRMQRILSSFEIHKLSSENYRLTEIKKILGHATTTSNKAVSELDYNSLELFEKLSKNFSNPEPRPSNSKFEFKIEFNIKF